MAQHPKVALCIRHARECSRNVWQQPAQHSAEYLRMRREAMQDARYWLKQPTK